MHDVRMVRPDSPKTMLVSSQRVGRDVGIATIVLRSGCRIAIPKTIQLFGIDRKHRILALQKCLDDRSSRHLDGHRNAVWLAFRYFLQNLQEVGYGLAAV